MAESSSDKRRSFLRHCVILLGGAAALLGIWGITRFALFGAGTRKIREVRREVLEKIEPDVPYHVRDAGTWLVKKRDQQIIALDDRCTHLGCRQNWNAEKQRFQCPCHGSEFDPVGNVLRGPASRPVPRLYVSAEGDEMVRILDKPPGPSPESPARQGGR